MLTIVNLCLLMCCSILVGNLMTHKEIGVPLIINIIAVVINFIAVTAFILAHQLETPTQDNIAKSPNQIQISK